MSGSRVRAAVAACALGAVAVAGCGSSEGGLCERSGDTEFCLVETEDAYEARGEGFEPLSNVVVVTQGEDHPGRDPALRADESGRIPADGDSLALQASDQDKQITVTGVTSDGEEVRFELTLPAASG